MNKTINVGDIFKSKLFGWLNNSRVTKIIGEKVYIENNEGETYDYTFRDINEELKDNSIVVISCKITNWRERLE